MWLCDPLGETQPSPPNATITTKCHFARFHSPAAQHTPAHLWHLYWNSFRYTATLFRFFIYLNSAQTTLHSHTLSLTGTFPNFWRRKQEWRLRFCRMVDSFWAWSARQPSSQLLPWTNGVSRTDRGTWWQLFTPTRVCGRTVRRPPQEWPSVARSMASWASQVGRDSLMF